MKPQKFRKNPIVIEAMQFDGNNGTVIQDWAGAEKIAIDFSYKDPPAPVLVIATLEGPLFAQVGDWIIKGIEEEFYPCKPDIFEKTYEAVE